MGSCLQRQRSSIESQTKSHVHNSQSKQKTMPTIEAKGSVYSISYTNNTMNKTSNTVTITALHSMTPPLAPTQRANSIDDHTNDILSDDDIFSCEAIRVAYQFWNDNLLSLSPCRIAEISVTLYAHMFKSMPECRKIFLGGGGNGRPRADIEETAERFLSMIGWLITQLHARNCEVWGRCKELGKCHTLWGITYEHYLPMLQAFHKTFQESFRSSYTLRIKFCIENLFMNAAKIMTGKDFVTLFAERVRDLEILEFLDSLDACLAHKTGREYFERYLEQTFCAEYVIFLRWFDDFKQLGNTQQRYETAKEIYYTHFDMEGRALIEFDDEIHIEHVQKLKNELDEYQEYLLNGENDTNAGIGNTEKGLILSENLLDDVYTAIKQMIELQSWDKFQSGIYSIKTATEIHKK